MFPVLSITSSSSLGKTFGFTMSPCSGLRLQEDHMISFKINIDWFTTTSFIIHQVPRKQFSRLYRKYCVTHRERVKRIHITYQFNLTLLVVVALTLCNQRWALFTNAIKKNTCDTIHFFKKLWRECFRNYEGNASEIIPKC